MTYGRTGTPEEVKKARAIMKDLGWAPFRPSSNAQLYPIRQLALNKDILKIEADDKISDDEKKAKIAKLRKKIDEISMMMSEIPNM